MFYTYKRVLSFPLTRQVKNLLGQGNTSGGTNSQPISPATTPQHAIQQQQQQQTPSSSGSGGVPWVMPTSGGSAAAMPSNVHVMSMSMPSSQQPTPSPVITSTAGNSVPVQSQPRKVFWWVYRNIGC